METNTFKESALMQMLTTACNEAVLSFHNAVAVSPKLYDWVRSMQPTNTDPERVGFMGVHVILAESLPEYSCIPCLLSKDLDAIPS